MAFSSQHMVLWHFFLYFESQQENRQSRNKQDYFPFNANMPPVLHKVTLFECDLLWNVTPGIRFWLTWHKGHHKTWKSNMIQTGKPANLASFCSTEEKLDIMYYSLKSACGFDFQDYFIHIA